MRAKTIQNRPEVNQRMTKHIILNQYAAEIERLQSDLLVRSFPLFTTCTPLTNENASL
jgi:hypothetical protein